MVNNTISVTNKDIKLKEIWQRKKCVFCEYATSNKCPIKVLHKCVIADIYGHGGFSIYHIGDCWASLFYEDFIKEYRPTGEFYKDMIP
jgi:hypothetical protein